MSGFIIGENLICRFFYDLPNHQIKSPRQIFPLYGIKDRPDDLYM